MSPASALARSEVHDAPFDRPLYTDEPEMVQGCEDCLELVAEDLQDPDNQYCCKLDAKR